jgi:hypothetical protein
VTLPWESAFVVLCAVVAGLGVIVFGLIQRLTFVLSESQKTIEAALSQLRVDGLQPGEFLDEFRAFTIDGADFMRGDLLAEVSVVLFISSSCQACADLLVGLETGSVPPLPCRLVVVSREQELAARVASGTWLVIKSDSAVVAAFKSHRTPHAFLVDRGGRVLANGSPNTWEELTRLAEAGIEGGDHQGEHLAAFASV